MSAYLVTRRHFLQRTSLALAGALAGGGLASAENSSASNVSIVVDPTDTVANGVAPQWAIAQLQQALKASGLTAKVFSSLDQVPPGDMAVMVGSAKATMARQILGTAGVTLPSIAETVALVPGTVSGRSVLLVSGHDPRGLLYGVTELTDRILCASSVREALTISSPVIEEAHNQVRSMCRSFQSDVEDKPWYNDKAFWTEYLSTLAAERFNRFHLCLGLAYNDAAKAKVTDAYFLFAYPFFTAVSAYQVSATNLPDAERDQNLAMLKFISDECARRAIDFQLGLWTHSYTYGPKAEPNHVIEGLTPETHAAYCRDALALLLRECPGITGVTFRVHPESGIPKGSYPFWQTVFSAVTPFVEAGRVLEIDMHAKECMQEHIDAALASKARAVVSPKYCGEHQGLPYHSASLELPERSKQPDTTKLDGQASRYGYSNFMKEDRPYGVLHRIWPGTQRVLLTGDPVFSAGYGRASSFCGSLGVEWCEPLSFKGREGSGIAGSRCGYADTSLNPTYDFQKFLYTYRVWGRLLYNPESDPQVWRRFLARQFGAAAQPSVEDALAHASRILLMVLQYHGASADNHDYWPEMYTNLSIVQNKLGMSFDPQLFLDPAPTAEALLNGSPFGRDQYSTIEFCQWLVDRSGMALASLTKAKASVKKADDADFRRLEVDVKMQSGLGLFFARKFRSAVLWSIFEKTNDASAKNAAVSAYTNAKEAWSDLADAASGYLPDVSYGSEAHQHGHWKDRLPGISKDIDAMTAATIVPPTTTPWTPDAIATAIKTAQGRVVRPVPSCEHTPPKVFTPGQALSLALKSGEPLSGVMFYYRHVNQADSWNSMPMTSAGGVWQATIPESYTQTAYPLQYYFALVQGPAHALFPGFDDMFSNQPYFVVRSVS
jgi:hypothetical protein